MVAQGASNSVDTVVSHSFRLERAVYLWPGAGTCKSEEQFAHPTPRFVKSLAAFLLRVALLRAFWKGGVVKERRKGWLFFKERCLPSSRVPSMHHNLSCRVEELILGAAQTHEFARLEHSSTWCWGTFHDTLKFMTRSCPSHDARGSRFFDGRVALQSLVAYLSASVLHQFAGLCCVAGIAWCNLSCGPQYLWKGKPGRPE